MNIVRKKYFAKKAPGKLYLLQHVLFHKKEKSNKSLVIIEVTICIFPNTMGVKILFCRFVTKKKSNTVIDKILPVELDKRLILFLLRSGNCKKKFGKFKKFHL